MVLYFAAMLTIGFIYSKRSNSSTKQYFAGGRGVGPWLTALSAEASDMSGWLLMGLPGVAYFTGTATVLIWHNLVKPLGGIFAIYELLPAFIVSLLFIVVISLLTPAPSAEVLHEFDHYLDDPDDRHVDDDLVAAEIAAGEKRSQI